MHSLLARNTTLVPVIVPVIGGEKIESVRDRRLQCGWGSDPKTNIPFSNSALDLHNTTVEAVIRFVTHSGPGKTSEGRRLSDH